MPVIADYLYRHGRCVRGIAIDERVDCPSNCWEFVWIGLTDPCADEIEPVQRLSNLHPLAVEEARKDGQLTSRNSGWSTTPRNVSATTRS